MPAELDGHPLRARYVETLDRAFETYARWIDPMREYWMRALPQPAGDSDAAWRIDHPRQGARQPARPPARGHALERRHLRHRPGLRGAPAPHAARTPCARSATTPTCMLVELRKVIPAFLQRLERPERGGVWSALSRRRRGGRPPRSRRACSTASSPSPRPEVTLTDFDPDGEVKVVAAALYASSRLPDDQLLAIARKLGAGGAAAGAGRLRGPAREPPPQARARLRAHRLSLRRARRLRRLPRSPAPPAAHARVAAALAPATAG